MTTSLCLPYTAGLISVGLLALSARPSSAADTFAEQQKAALAANPAGVTSTLHIDGDRTTFHIGEAIPVTVEYRSTSARWLYAEPQIGSDTGFAIDPQQGLVEDVPAIYTFYEGPPPPDPVAFDKTPIRESLTLNRKQRFSQPGHYRIYAIGASFVDANSVAAPKPSLSGVAGQSVTSNMVEITILPRDPSWEKAQYEVAQHRIETGSQTEQMYGNQVAPTDALESLIRLGTPDAARLLLRRLALNNVPGWSGNDGFICEQGLESLPDRAWLLQQMRRDLDDPNYAVSIDFLRTFGAVTYMGAHTERGANELEETLPGYWQSAVDAAARKAPGRTRAMTWYSLAAVYHQFVQSQFHNEAMAAQMPTIRKKVIETFDDLPIQPKEMLLSLYWDWFHGPDVLPTLQHFKSRTPNPFPYRSDSHLLDRAIAQLSAGPVTAPSAP